MCPNVRWRLSYLWYHKKFENIKIFWLLAYSQTLNWCQVCLAWVKSYTELWFLAVMSINNVDWLIIIKIFKYKNINKKTNIFRQCVPQCGMVPLVSRSPSLAILPYFPAWIPSKGSNIQLCVSMVVCLF